MTRSFPEKTLEHWCSIHLTYRYRAKLLMWWPAVTADIEITQPAGMWGKRFWLELKTTEWNGTKARHELRIDLAQLAAYGQQPIPDYYVFPIPPWDGVLGDLSSYRWLATGRERLAYESWSGDHWFVHWTRVVPGWVLRQHLHAELAALAPGKKKQLLIGTISNGVLRPVGTALQAAPQLPWRDFWAHMDSCGDDTWGAQFLLRTGALPGGAAQTPTRSDLATALRGLRDTHAVPTADTPVATYTPLGDVYAPTPSTGRYDAFDWASHRSLATLTQEAIRG